MPNRREGTSWRDTMQVCLNGHVINSGFHKYPNLNKDFCDECGEKTITNCPNCNKPILGELQDTVVSFGFPKKAPEYCQNCGKPFPWQTKKEVYKIEVDKEKPIEILEKLFSRFHWIVRRLSSRYNNRPTLDVSDEYDVQDLLYALLRLFFDDIRPEEGTPSYAGGSARMDILLKKEKIVIEVKMTRRGLGEKEIGGQLLQDIERYKEHEDCENLVCFIYDPEGRIRNPMGLINDLNKQSREDFKVTPFIYPH